MAKELVGEAEPKLQAVLDHLNEELRTIRSGRASTSLVEDLKVTYYEQQMPLKQLASITAPDATTIAISPWEPGAVDAIVKAISEDKDLDLNPTSDGKTIHIQVPSPTAERREQLVKQIGEKVEQCQISLRNIRHEVLNDAKKLNQSKDMGDDDYHRILKQIDAKIEQLQSQVDELAETKRKDVSEI